MCPALQSSPFYSVHKVTSAFNFNCNKLILHYSLLFRQIEFKLEATVIFLDLGVKQNNKTEYLFFPDSLFLGYTKYFIIISSYTCRIFF